MKFIGSMDKLITLSRNRENNFDFLRFFAALLVIISHSYILSGNTFEPFFYVSGYDTMGVLAVEIFFVMSGFLIAKSWMKHQRAAAFLGKRIIRIFPGLIAGTLFGIFVIGFIFTAYPLNAYFTNPSTWHYLYNITLLKTVYGLPGVFAKNPYAFIVNGSIWTLPYEFIMYIVLLILGVIGLLRKRWQVLAIVIILLIIELFYLNNPKSYIVPIGYYDIRTLTNLAIFFLTGSIFYLFRKDILINNLIALVILILYLLSFNHEIYLFSKYICLPYLVIFIAHKNIWKISRFGRFGDYSYGMYIYAFPVQQAIIAYLPGTRTRALFLLTVPITFMISFISWHTIEKPALSYKKYFNKVRYPIIKTQHK